MNNSNQTIDPLPQTEQIDAALLDKEQKKFFRKQYQSIMLWACVLLIAIIAAFTDAVYKIFHPEWNVTYLFFAGVAVLLAREGIKVFIEAREEILLIEERITRRVKKNKRKLNLVESTSSSGTDDRQTAPESDKQ